MTRSILSRWALVVVVASLSVGASPAVAQELQGFAEGRVALFSGVTGDTFQFIERVRPTLTADLFERVRLVATVEGALVQGRHPAVELDRTLRASDLWPLLEASGYESPTFENSLLRVNNSQSYLDVDRLYVDVYTDVADLRLGRQAVNWGSAQFFNPTDPFPEVLLAEPWRPRRGVNAARINLPFGGLNDAAVVIAMNDALTEPRAAGRVRIHVAETDIAAVAVWRGPNSPPRLGLDLRGTLVVGWWVEGAAVLDEDPHFEVAVGVDYSFPILERATVMAQYYRNGGGDPDGGGGGLADLAGGGGGIGGIGGGLGVGATRDRDPFAPFVRGRDYLLGGGSLGITPELSSSVFVLQNLNDGSGAFIPSVTYAALDWLDVAANAQIPYAIWKSGELKPDPDDLVIEVPTSVPGQVLTADLSGLVPTATFTLWARVNY